MIYTFLQAALSAMNLLIIIRCIMSFIPHNPYGSLMRYVYEITNPVLNLCARYMPESLRYPLDFTPMVALIVLQLAYRVLVGCLHVLF